MYLPRCIIFVLDCTKEQPGNNPLEREEFLHDFDFQKMDFLYNKHDRIILLKYKYYFDKQCISFKRNYYFFFSLLWVTCLVTMITDYIRAQPKPRAVTLEPNLRNRRWKLGSRFTRTAQSCYGLERRVICVGISVRFHSDCVAARVSMYGSGGSNKN